MIPVKPQTKPLCRSAHLPGITELKRCAIEVADQKAGLRIKSHLNPNFGVSLHLEILWFCWNADLKYFLRIGLREVQSQKHLSRLAQPHGQVGLCYPAKLLFVPFSKAWGWISPRDLLPTPSPSLGLTHHLGFFVIPHLCQKEPLGHIWYGGATAAVI